MLHARSIVCLVACALAALALGATRPSAGAVVAQCGFNDQAGIHADPVADSPYTFGQSIHERGESEPGWSMQWQVSDGGAAMGRDLGKAVADSTAPEGDGILHVEIGALETTWVYRQWSEPLFMQFRIEQHVRLPYNGEIGSRPRGTGVIAFACGPSWATENNRFRVLDGDGAGGGTWEDTGLDVAPMQWHKVTLIGDVTTQTWDFYVDDVRYNAPDPLNFRGGPPSLCYIDYLASTDVWLDRIRIVPEPASLLVLAAGAVGLLARRRLR